MAVKSGYYAYYMPIYSLSYTVKLQISICILQNNLDHSAPEIWVNEDSARERLSLRDRIKWEIMRMRRADNLENGGMENS